MSKLDTAPFEIHQHVYWSHRTGQGYKSKLSGVITDAYYQKKTHNKKEGWKLLIKKDYSYGEKTHLEKYYDELKQD